MKSIPTEKTPLLLQKIRFTFHPINTLESYAKKYGDIFIATASLHEQLIVSNTQAFHNASL